MIKDPKSEPQYNAEPPACAPNHVYMVSARPLDRSETIYIPSDPDWPGISAPSDGVIDLTSSVDSDVIAVSVIDITDSASDGPGVDMIDLADSDSSVIMMDVADSDSEVVILS
jgi:hypothetical protein